MDIFHLLVFIDFAFTDHYILDFKSTLYGCIYRCFICLNTNYKTLLFYKYIFYFIARDKLQYSNA